MRSFVYVSKPKIFIRVLKRFASTRKRFLFFFLFNLSTSKAIVRFKNLLKQAIKKMSAFEAFLVVYPRMEGFNVKEISGTTLTGP